MHSHAMQAQIMDFLIPIVTRWSEKEGVYIAQARDITARGKTVAMARAGAISTWGAYVTIALDTFASKGPVNLIGAKCQAATAFSRLRPILLPAEVDALIVAIGHSAMREGRQEFDEIMKTVRARIEDLPWMA